MKGRVVSLLLLVCACICMYAVGANVASAAVPDDSWTYPCGGADNLDYATCERVTYIAQATRDAADNSHSDLFVLIGVLVAGFTVPPLFRVMFGGPRS